MGIDVGFDMVPRLSDSKVDSNNWKNFLHQVEQKFKNDKIFSRTEKFLEFQVGEQPRLTIDPQKFCRFSSKVTGSCFGAFVYIEEVYNIAKKNFGPRVRFWNEEAGNAYYDWNEVYAVQTYD